MRNLLLALILAATTFAGQAAETPVNESAVEKRVTALSQELRCLVCQNQTIADSQAGLAVDLKNQIREKIAQGMSDSQIVDYMVERYGDFVLYRPPVKATTMLLWFGPITLLVVGVFVLFRYLARRRKEQPADVPLTDAEQKRARALLGMTDKEST